jgi:C2 domain
MLDKGYFKDAMIGMYEFDVAYIYFMKQHSLLHKWLALSNPASPNFSEVCGYLKISISVAATGDEQIQITEDNGKDEESILMPPQMKPEFYQLRFRFFKAEKLPIMDAALFGSGGSIDAYIMCNYLNQKLKTKVVTMKNEFLFWNQEFLIPVQLPIMSGRLVMKLYDQDQFADEIVGSIIFNLKDCINILNGKMFWKNIYGAPLGKSGENTNRMNSNPELGSTWKGRILMQVTAEKTEAPQIKLEDLKEDVI